MCKRKEEHSWDHRALKRSRYVVFEIDAAWMLYSSVLDRNFLLESLTSNPTLSCEYSCASAMYAQLRKWSQSVCKKYVCVRFYCEDIVKHKIPTNTFEPKPFRNIPGPKSLPVIGTLYKYLPLIEMDQSGGDCEKNFKSLLASLKT